MDKPSPRNEDSVRKVIVLGVWLLLFLACIIAYVPGLHGPFVFDDFGTVAGLGDRGGVSSWETFKAFVFGGNSGPTGRPVAMATFLIDADNWPADSFPFKRTNLVLHLLNGALLGLVISQLLGLLRYGRRQIRWITLVSVACWLLHPFLVSTTLYIVQRMAQLVALFSFAGIAAYLHGRALLERNLAQGYLVMSGAVGIFSILAFLSKENGMLLPMLIGTIEITVIASQRNRLLSLNRAWVFVFLVVPAGVVLSYLAMQVFTDSFFDIPVPRDYSQYERLLTQSRVLVDYLQHWFVPNLYTTGVFQDHFIKSTAFFSPLTTALSTLLHVVLIAAAFAKRKSWPLFALAVLFFYTAHLLESTVVNLELYFEHRNYLPACFLFLPLIAWLHRRVAWQAFIVAALALTLLLGGFLRYSATVWESYPGMAAASARKAPTSARAQSQFATQLFNKGQAEAALQVLDRAIEVIPYDKPQLLLNRLIILCEQNALDDEEYQRTARVLAARRYDPRLLTAYSSFVEKVIGKTCPKITIDSLQPMFADMLKVPENADPGSLLYSQIMYLNGLVSAYSNKPSDAMAAFEKSLAARPGASHAMEMAARMATNGYYDEALRLSDLALMQMDAERLSPLTGARVSEADIRTFQDVVRADRDAAQSGDTSGPET